MGYEPALPATARALAAFRAEGFSRENIAWCGLACQLALELWDDAGCEEIARGLGRVARERGRWTVLPFALNHSAARQLFLGEFGVAEQLIAEAEAITAAMGCCRYRTTGSCSPSGGAIENEPTRYARP